MARLTPEEAAAKWAQRTGAATEDYRRGIQRVQTAPGALAARQVQKYVAKVQQRAPVWQARTGAVTLGEWQEASIEKGIPRLATGVQAAQPKMAAFMSEVLPHIDRGRAQLTQLPSLSPEDSVARAAFWIRHMMGFRRGGAGPR